MKAEMRAVTVDMLRGELADDPARDVVLNYVTLADPLFIGEIGGEPIVVVAFIPMTTLSDIAYSWVHVLAAGRWHKHAIARLFKRWKPIAHTRYKQIIAHCSASPEHLAWIRFTGARRLEEFNGIIKFVIEDTA